jgi:predicted nuclease of predicted toxin-antitoxin system
MFWRESPRGEKDEDAQDKLLVKLLRNAGHDVITVNEAGLMSSSDSIVLDYARTNNRLLLTYNCDDFEELHKAQPLHLGILAVYRDKNSSKNMSFQQIVRAIANLESFGIPLANQFIALNHWNY